MKVSASKKANSLKGSIIKTLNFKNMPKCISCKNKIKDDYNDGREEFICSDCYNILMNERDSIVQEIREILPVSDGFVSWDDIAIMIYKIKSLIKK